ncbi:MAG: GMC family oxidoreductase [Leptolyngbya sp. SIO1D8]|nr:GMC family oxidoreductase [Leptolyngbya sp. SIO1D8]
MIIDARTLSGGEILEGDICIVGAGPAGMTIARELAGEDCRIFLVESGGFDLDPATQALTDGVVVGDPYPALPETRQRRFGGSSHLWEAQAGYKRPGWRCLPLDPIDFEQRDWIPYSGWPFDRAHLDPFYERAHQVCQIGPYTYLPEACESQGAKPLSLTNTQLVTKMSQYGARTPFTDTYRQEIASASNIETLLYANVINLELDSTLQSVNQIHIANLNGSRFSLKAKLVILATGGIENARLLLLSNQQQTAGLGNQHDLVGRFFMERPIVTCGHLIPANRRLFGMTGLYDVREIDHYGTMAWLSLQESVMRQEQLLNSGAQLFPRPKSQQMKGKKAFRKLVSAVKSGDMQTAAQSLPPTLKGMDYLAAASFWSLVRRLPGLQRGDWSYLPFEKSRFSTFEVIYQLEQAPNPNNRVTLSSEKDTLGQPTSELHWRLNPIDVETVHRVQAIWQTEFAKAGLGELQLAGDGEALKFDKLAIHHHMGTTRMHVDPKQGVVDANGQVHGVQNLFLTGCSVFPTAGYANPTLTIIALALRLADHVKQRLKNAEVNLAAATTDSSVNLHK